MRFLNFNKYGLLTNIALANKSILPKYKLLTSIQLLELEQEFVQYLILNGIAADDWVKINDESPERAQKIIELFSDVVYEKILRKTRFIKLVHKHSIRCFQCLEKKMVMMGVNLPMDSSGDFTDWKYLEKSMQNPPNGLKVFTAENEYSKARELEIFEWIQQGAIITKGSLFKTISLVYASTSGTK